MTHEMARSIIKQETQEQTADRIIELYQVISEYAEQRDRLREALEFYADGDWNERYPCGVWYDHDEAIIDFGQVARAALRKVDDD